MVVNQDILGKQKDRIRDLPRWVHSLFSDEPFEASSHAISQHACYFEDPFTDCRSKLSDAGIPLKIQQLQRWIFVPSKSWPNFSFMTPRI